MKNSLRVIGVSNTDVAAIYSKLRLRNDINLTPQKYKADVKIGIRNGGMAVSICKNGNVAVITDASRRHFEHYYRIKIFDNGTVLDTFTGPISTIMTSFPKGDYYTFDTTISGNEPFCFRREKQLQVNVSKTTAQFNEDVFGMVHGFINDTVKERCDELTNQIKAVLDSANDGGAYDIIEQEHIHIYARKSVYDDLSFDTLIDNFKTLADLHKSEELDDHVKRVIESLTINYFGISSGITYRRMKFITNEYKTSSGRLDSSLKTAEKRLDTMIGDDLVWRDPSKPKPIQYRKMVREVSFNVLWFYKRFIGEETEVNFWPHNKTAALMAK